MSKKIIYLISFVLVLCLAGNAMAQIDPATVTTGHVYLFDNVSGGQVPDDSANNNTGTIVGNPQVVDGLNGKALQFDGVDDGVNIPDSQFINVTGGPFPNRTVIAVFNCADVTKQEKQTVFEEGGRTRGLTIYVFDGEVYVGGWNRAEYNWDPGSWLSAPINSNEWHAVAFVIRDGGEAQEDNKFEMWMDGQLIGRAPGGQIHNHSNDNAIGYTLQNNVFHDDDGSGDGWYFEGIIDELWILNDALTAAELSAIGPRPTKAKNPVPAIEATNVPRDVVLGWEAGIYAPAVSGHKVYLSENFNDVNDGVGGIVQDANSYTPPQRLDFGTTYYWRVDEVNGPPDYTVYEGDLWSFTTEPFGYPVENITVTASSSQPDRGPENTINGSGLDANDLHSRAGTDMWLSGITGPQPTWIEFQLDKVYKLHEMWVWNSNEAVELAVGFGLKDVTIEYSANGIDYKALGTTHEFAQAIGMPGYAHNTTVDFGGVGAKYVRLTANSNWGGLLPQYGLSEVRLFYIPVQATEPYPADGATDVSIGTIDEPVDVVLGFRAGREAATHDVYFSDSWRAVANGTAAVTTMTETSYGPLSVDLGKTYYWRVDEVNEAETPQTWQGDIWNFTTQGYFIVDDFESYNDLDPMDPNSNRIFLTWIDGYGVPTNGSVVGYEVPPFAEQGIVNSGAQSMPYLYDNSVGYSEATATLGSTRDWIARGVKALSLWFRGYPLSVSSFTEEPAGVYRLAVRSVGNISGGDSDEFHFAYQQLTGPGSIIARVDWLRDADDNAQAGVMIRDTLDADSPHAAVLLESNDIAADADLRFRRRATKAADSTTTTVDGPMAPQWLRLERDVAGIVTGAYSPDGVTWTDLGGDTITMSAPIYIGLAVASENAGVTCEAQFSNVQITGASGQWANQDVGIVNNDPESMYVAVANSGGTPAVVYWDDPDDPDATPTQIGGWTEWNIDLKALADQGVNLANVDTISIGLGDKNNPQPAGSGMMFFDDIRLYPARCMPLLLKPAMDLNDDCVVDHLELEIAAADWLKSDSLVEIPSVAPDSAGLVLHYAFDGDARDSSGNNYHGIEMDGPTYVEGKFGQAIHLDGLDDYVAITDVNYAGTGYAEVTAAAWVRTTDNAGNIASYDRSENWRLEVGGQYAGGDGLVGMEVWTSDGQVDTGAVPEWPDNTGRVDDGQWHHVAGVFDNGTLIIYIDGNPKEPYFGGTTFGRGRYPRYGIVGGGCEASYPPPSGRANGPYLEADLDELYIYDRALSQAEIRYLADDTPGDGELYVPVPSVANVYDGESLLSRSVNFKDFVLLADGWLDEQLWPAP